MIVQQERCWNLNIYLRTLFCFIFNWSVYPLISRTNRGPWPVRCSNALDLILFLCSLKWPARTCKGSLTPLPPTFNYLKKHQSSFFCTVQTSGNLACVPNMQNVTLFQVGKGSYVTVCTALVWSPFWLSSFTKSTQ